MECEFCGAEIADGALACPRCGSPVTTAAARAARAPENMAAPPPGPGAGPPLARHEEDFIAMAEEALGDAVSAVPDDREAPAPSPAVPPPVADAGLGLPPGAHTQAPVALDSSLTGGYRGESAGGASVAGAGEQTADDPFGLRITEQAPPLPGEAGGSRGRNWRNWWNMAVGVTVFLLAAVVCYAGIYYGFLREDGPSEKAPVAAVEELCRQVVSGDVSRLGTVSLPDSPFGAELAGALKRYEQMGIMSIKEFEGEATAMSEAQATVVIRKLLLRVMTPSGAEETIDLLAAGSGPGMRTTLTLVNRDGSWLVGN